MINEFIAFIIFEVCYLGLLFYIFYITDNLSFFKYLLGIREKKGQRYMKAFYSEVKEQLERKGMTIYRLSKETGILEQTLYSMFNGNTSSPQLDNAVKIAKVLDIDLNKLKVGD